MSRFLFVGLMALLAGCEEGSEKAALEPEEAKALSIVEPLPFCDAAQAEKLLQQLVRKPITPNGSLGGIPLTTPTGQRVMANELVGVAELGKFCDPTAYSNALTWGAAKEIIAFIHRDTQEVLSIAATPKYLGALRGFFTRTEGRPVEVEIRPGEHVRIGSRALNQYTSSAEQAKHLDAWLNSKNLSDIYRMLRQTYFGAAVGPGFDCVAERRCQVIHDQVDESGAQKTTVRIQDSGVTLGFSPEGHITWVEIEAVR